MTFKSYFYTATAFICFGSLSVPAHAGQLFPPANIGTKPNVSCPSGSVLTWHGDHVDCADPTPGVTVSCPAGQIMTGIANGQAVCVATPTCHVVTDRGGAPDYISDARCSAGEFLLSGGGRAETPGSDLCSGTSRGFIHTSIPDADLMGWTVDAFNSTWTGEACTEAYAVCCAVP